jgi:hypothetical protein
MAISALELQRLYLAYFGRPADRDGMDFYLAPGAEWKIFAGPPDVTLGFSESPESRALYGSTFGAEQIDAIYMNLFNRHAEQGGIDYWLGQVQKGELTPAGAAYGILVGAKNDDAIAVASKLALCEEFFAAVDTSEEIEAYRGDEVAALIRAYVHSVDHTSESLKNARDALQAKIGEMVDPVTGPVEREFTTGADHLSGTEFDDHFEGTVGGAGATVQAGDSVDGGEGSDTLHLTVQQGATEMPDFTAARVERVLVRNASAQAFVIDAGQFGGALLFNSQQSTTGLHFRNLGAGDSVGYEDDNAAALVFDYGANVKVADLQIGANSTGALTVGGADIERTVVSTGTARAERSLGTLRLAGANNDEVLLALIDGDYTIGHLAVEADDAIVRIQASGSADRIKLETLDPNFSGLDATGAATAVEVHSGQGVPFRLDFNFTGGSGDDVYHVRGALTAGQVNGAVGDDTLVIHDDAFFTNATRYSAFEKLRIASIGSFDLTEWNDVRAVEVVGAAADVALINLTAEQARNLRLVDISSTETPIVLTGALDDVQVTLSGTPLPRIQGLNADGRLTVTSDIDYFLELMAESNGMDEFHAVGTGALTLDAHGSAFTAATLFDFSQAGTGVQFDATGSQAQEEAPGLRVHDSAHADTLVASKASDSFTYQGGADVVTMGEGGDTFDFNDQRGSDVLGSGVTFKVNALQSYSNVNGELDFTPGGAYDPAATDSISVSSSVAYGASAGTKFVIDTEIAGAEQVERVASLRFGTTTAAANGGFVVLQLAGSTDAYIFQDGTDGNFAISRTDLMIEVVGIGSISDGEFTVEDGNLVFTSR